MTFTKQDLYTFLMGLGAAVAIETALVLKDFDTADPDWERLGALLLTGTLGAAFRYFGTRIPELVRSRRVPH